MCALAIWPCILYASVLGQFLNTKPDSYVRFVSLLLIQKKEEAPSQSSLGNCHPVISRILTQDSNDTVTMCSPHGGDYMSLYVLSRRQQTALNETELRESKAFSSGC